MQVKVSYEQKRGGSLGLIKAGRHNLFNSKIFPNIALIIDQFFQMIMTKFGFK